MIDAMLYKVDGRGRLVGREKCFRTLRELARFFASDAGRCWEWAEVDRPAARRYSAAELRAMSEADPMTMAVAS